MTMTARRVVASVLAIVLAVCATAAFAQDYGFMRRLRRPIEGAKTRYDGRFTFARLRHGLEGGRGELEEGA